jgi:hypothetical protein
VNSLDDSSATNLADEKQSEKSDQNDKPNQKSCQNDKPNQKSCQNQSNKGSSIQKISTIDSDGLLSNLK